jgi:hypothetical protein
MENKTNNINDYCEMCNETCNNKIDWVNVIYILLIVFIAIFLLTIMINSPFIAWMILLVLLLIWFFTGMDTTLGLILLAVFLIILLILPSRKQDKNKEIVIEHKGQQKKGQQKKGQQKKGQEKKGQEKKGQQKKGQQQ